MRIGLFVAVITLIASEPAEIVAAPDGAASATYDGRGLDLEARERPLLEVADAIRRATSISIRMPDDLSTRPATIHLRGVPLDSLGDHLRKAVPEIGGFSAVYESRGGETHLKAITFSGRSAAAELETGDDSVVSSEEPATLREAVTQRVLLLKSIPEDLARKLRRDPQRVDAQLPAMAPGNEATTTPCE